MEAEFEEGRGIKEVNRRLVEDLVVTEDGREKII